MKLLCTVCTVDSILLNLTPLSIASCNATVTPGDERLVDEDEEEGADCEDDDTDDDDNDDDDEQEMRVFGECEELEEYDEEYEETGI